MKISYFSAKSLITMASIACSSAVFAAGDMLTPDEVQRTGISSKPSNDSGLFLGAGLGFGQGRSTEDGSTAGMAWSAHFEPGYQINRGDWGRLEVSADLFTGSIAWRNSDDTPDVPGKSTLTTPFGLLIKGGYGYSLGGDVFGLVTAGVGPVMGKYEIDPPGNQGKAKSDSLSGFAWQLGWRIVAPINKTLDFTGGIEWTQINYDVDKVKQDGASFSIDRNIIANVPGADIGLRIRL